MKIQVNAYDPYNIAIKDWLYHNECDIITKNLGFDLEIPPEGIPHESKKDIAWTDVRTMKK